MIWSEDKGLCHQAWGSELDPQDPERKGGREEGKMEKEAFNCFSVTQLLHRLHACSQDPPSMHSEDNDLHSTPHAQHRATVPEMVFFW